MHAYDFCLLFCVEKRRKDRKIHAQQCGCVSTIPDGVGEIEIKKAVEHFL